MGFSFVERGVTPDEREHNRNLLVEGVTLFPYEALRICDVRAPLGGGKIFGYDANDSQIAGDGRDFIVLGERTSLVKVYLQETPTSPERRIGTIYWTRDPELTP